MTMQTFIARIHANVHDDDAWDGLFDVLVGPGKRRIDNHSQLI